MKNLILDWHSRLIVDDYSDLEMLEDFVVPLEHNYQPHKKGNQNLNTSNNDYLRSDQHQHKSSLVSDMFLVYEKPTLHFVPHTNHSNDHQGIAPLLHNYLLREKMLKQCGYDN